MPDLRCGCGSGSGAGAGTGKASTVDTAMAVMKAEDFMMNCQAMNESGGIASRGK